jgi:hypothetical protein
MIHKHARYARSLKAALCTAACLVTLYAAAAGPALASGTPAPTAAAQRAIDATDATNAAVANAATVGAGAASAAAALNGATATALAPVTSAVTSLATLSGLSTALGTLGNLAGLGGLSSLLGALLNIEPLLTSWQLTLPGIVAYDVGQGDAMDLAMDHADHVLQIDLNVYNNYVTGIDHMTDQFAYEMAEQIGIIGAFMDSKNQLETQRLLQDLDARAHKDYEPSTQMCIIGTNTKSLAMSDQKGKANAYIMANAMLSRSMMSKDNETGGGTASDMQSRLDQYARVYCDINDDAAGLQPLCGDKNPPQAQRNRDIDYPDLVDEPLTLDVDFTNAALTNDEQDVLALSRNLFGSRLPDYIPSDLLTAGPAGDMGPGAWMFQNARSLQAIRGVAENSFSHLVGMKARGGDNIYDFASQIIKELGVPEADLEKFLGKNPSYFAQMDVLTKRILMAPDFYANLFTSPANVQRLGVTLQAIKLMNDRDRFEGSLRREMLISLIVEMKIREQERVLDNELLGTVPNLYIQ